MRRRLLLGYLILTLSVLFSICQAKIFRLEFFPSDSPLDDYGAKRVVPHPKLGLALSGGGARGFAHIGVLKVLERENIPISAIAGTSMGGAIGGLFAAGYSATELESLVLSINWQDIFSDTPPRLSLLQPQREEAEGALFQIRFDGLKPLIPSGLTSAQKLTNLFSGLTFGADYFSGLDFDRLRIPFRSVTTDLISGQKVVLDSGELAMALRATIAVPLAITPLSYDGKLLVDGGLVDPVPVEVVRNLGADLVIAVNTSATLLPEEKIQDPLDIASQAVSIMSLEQKIQSLASADLVLEPVPSGFSSTDFAEAESLILFGEKAADSLLPEIRRRMEQDLTPRFEIGEIQFEGNKVIPADSLINWSGLRAPATVSEKEIYDCLSRIYHSGYFRDVEAELDTVARPANLTIRVKENPVVQQIVVQIKSQGSNLTGQTFHYFPESRVLRYQEPEQIVDKRVSELRQQGSSLARLAVVEYQPESARLTAVIDQGKIVKLNLSGNRQTKNWMVYSNFPLKAGKVFNQNLAQKGIANLQSSGYFDQVRLTAKNSPAGVSLNLSLTERNFSLLRGGAHWWDEYHLEGFLESGYLSLLGTGNQIFLKALYGERKANYSISLKANRIFKTYLTYNLSLHYRTEENFLYDRHADIGEFKEIRRGGRFSLGHNIARLGRVSAEFQAERISLYNSFLNQSQGENKRSILFKIMFDNLDRYPYPNKGNYNQLQMEMASRILKGDVSYRKFYTSLETYLPLTDKLNFHPTVETGYSDKKLPLYEQFSLGGIESFYGFYSEEKRGNKLGMASLELRLQTAKRIFWFLRYDIGDTWEDKVEFRKPKHAIGIKLGITTPLGPMELAYGYSSLHFRRVHLIWGYQF